MDFPWAFIHVEFQIRHSDVTVCVARRAANGRILVVEAEQRAAMHLARIAPVP